MEIFPPLGGSLECFLNWSFIPWAEVGKGKGLEISIDQGFVSPEKR